MLPSDMNGIRTAVDVHIYLGPEQDEWLRGEVFRRGRGTSQSAVIRELIDEKRQATVAAAEGGK